MPCPRTPERWAMLRPSRSILFQAVRDLFLFGDHENGFLNRQAAEKTDGREQGLMFGLQLKVVGRFVRKCCFVFPAMF
jgi:hypothetical protein